MMKEKYFKIVNERLLKHFTQEILNDLNINIKTWTEEELKYYFVNDSDDMGCLISDLNISLHERACFLSGIN